MMNQNNLTHNDIEFYLLNREYNELKGQEKTFVDEHVDSEQEFNELKAVMQGVVTIGSEEPELVPDPKIKAHLLQEFEKNRPAGGYWLNGIFIALFPKEKKFLKKPGVQLIGIAASISLLIGIFLNVETFNNKEMAQHKADDIVAPSEEKNEEELEKTGEEVLFEVEETLSETVADEAEDLGTFKNEQEKDLSADNSARGDFESEIVDALAEVENAEPVEESKEMDYKLDANNDDMVLADYEDLSVAEEETEAELSELIIEGGMAATTERASTPSPSVSQTISTTDASTEAASKDYRDGKKDIATPGRTLSEDAELIGLLFTAL